MEITMDYIRGLIGVMPGNVVAYHVRDKVYRLCYTCHLPLMLGYTEEEYAQQPEFDSANLIYEADRESTMQQLKESVRNGTEANCNYRIIQKDGNTVWVRARARLLGELDGYPVMLTAITQFTIDEMQLDLINRVPVGMGIYEVEDGIPSLLYLNDSYFYMMGFTREERSRFNGQDTISAVHPHDRALILNGIHSALAKDGHFRVVIRMVTEIPNEYHWLQLEGRIANRSGDRTTFYVSFTKIDDLEQAKAELEKSQTMLHSAIGSAKIEYFEYYPNEHYAIGHNSNNRFNLPFRLENYPQCLFDQNLVHPEDADTLHKTFDEIHAGKSPVTWEGRLLTSDKYTWFHAVLTAMHDAVHDRPVIVCTMTDITLPKEALAAYHNHLDSIMRMNPDAISSFQMNLTKNTCRQGFSSYENILQLQQDGTMEGFFQKAEPFIPDTGNRDKFHAMFDRKTLLKRFEQGQKNFSLEHPFRLEKGHTEWITTLLDCMRNPITGDVEAVLYTLNVNERRIEHLMIQGFIQYAYDGICVIDVNTDEYFLFRHQEGIYGEHHTNFSAYNDVFLQHMMGKEEWQRVAPMVTITQVLEMVQKQDTYAVPFECRTPDGIQRKQVSYTIINREQNTLVAAIRDFTNRELLEQFRHTSEHDLVTGLYNRAKTFQMCRKIIDAHPDETIALCHFDIQRFHLVNSFYGDEEGNILLKGVGKLFEELAKQYPYAAYGRIDADIFCLCFPLNMQLLEKQIALVEKWLSNYRKDFFLEGACGIYVVKNRELPIEAMFSRATMASKIDHKSLVHRLSFYNDEMEHSLQMEQQITNDMRIALEQEQFQVYLQPKYTLKDSRPCGAEALVRWEHPEKGLISPADFIPLFEKNGFIIQLDQYMWEHVCQLLRSWLDAGIQPNPISVNVSRVSMYSPNTISFLNGLMEKYQLPHDLMQLELTESAFMDDPDEMKLRLLELQRDGFIILMDDFGSGYSSLNTLRELPVDYLKVDMKFLSATKDDERSRLILASVIRMACWLQLPVITEGVETPEQREFLNSVGCTYAQGFLFARPMPVLQYEQNVLGDNAMIPTALPQDQLEMVAQMISSSNELALLFTECVPVPLAYVDLAECEYSYLRANQEFQDTFGFGRDLIEKEQLLAEHLDEENYHVMLEAYRKAAALKGRAECIYYWKDAQRGTCCYLMRAQYLGQSAYSTILMATFFDVTAYNRFEKPQSIAARPFRNQFTIPQLENALRILRNVFDLARVVQPETNAVLTVDAKWKTGQKSENCFGCWGKATRCENCISGKALVQKRTMFKLEQRGQETFFVFSYPVELLLADGTVQNVTIELVTKPDERAMEAVLKGSLT